MAQARLSVRKIREVLRLKAESGLSDRQIAAVIGSALTCGRCDLCLCG